METYTVFDSFPALGLNHTVPLKCNVAKCSQVSLLTRQ